MFLIELTLMQINFVSQEVNQRDESVYQKQEKKLVTFHLIVT